MPVDTCTKLEMFLEILNTSCGNDWYPYLSRPPSHCRPNPSFKRTLLNLRKQNYRTDDSSSYYWNDDCSNLNSSRRIVWKRPQSQFSLNFLVLLVCELLLHSIKLPFSTQIFPAVLATKFTYTRSSREVASNAI